MDSPHVAQTNWVLVLVEDGSMYTVHFSPCAEPAVTGGRTGLTPKPAEASPESMVPPWFHHEKMNCSEDVKQILLNSRTTATHNACVNKRFSIWY